MIKIAIVEDNLSDEKVLKSYLDQYSKDNSVTFDVVHFKNGIQFLTNYAAIYDIIMMDIDMPHINGLDAAKRLRIVDPVTPLLFITNLAQYAINGYEVNAKDYILKPINYPAFALRFSKVLNVAVKNSSECIVINKRSGSTKIATRTISYVEVCRHDITFHTDSGTIEAYGTLNQFEEKLKPLGFERCNSYYLVNLAYVTSVNSQSVIVGGVELAMSRNKRAEFIEKLNLYLAGKQC